MTVNFPPTKPQKKSQKRKFQDDNFDDMETEPISKYKGNLLKFKHVFIVSGHLNNNIVFFGQLEDLASTDLWDRRKTGEVIINQK